MGTAKIHRGLRVYLVLQVGVFKGIASYRSASVFIRITYRVVRVGVKPNKSVIWSESRRCSGIYVHIFTRLDYRFTNRSD